MLIDFYVSNFKSYDHSDENDQGIRMTPSGIRSKPGHITSTGLLRSAVIFGANSSGKSSMIDAIGFIRSLIIDKKDINPYINTYSCLNHSINQRLTSRFSFHILVNQKPSIMPTIIPNKASNSLLGDYSREYIYEIEIRFGFGSSYDIISETIWKVENSDCIRMCSSSIPVPDDYYDAQRDAIIESNKINSFNYKSSGLEYSLKVSDLEQRISNIETKIVFFDSSDNSDSLEGLNAELDSLKAELTKLQRFYTVNHRNKLKSQMEEMKDHFINVTLKNPSLTHEFRKESFLCPDPNYSKLRDKFGFKDRIVPIKEIEEAISSIYSWFNQTLVVVNPHKFILPNMNSDSFDRLSDVISQFDIGINRLVWHTESDPSAMDALLDSVSDHDKDLIRQCWQTSTNSVMECSVIVGDLSGLFLFSFFHGEPVVKKLMTMHDDDPVPHDLVEESNGTRRLIELCSVLVSHPNDRVYVVDELDCRLHPLVTKRFIEEFFRSGSNDFDSQLIVSTHETRLMSTDLFRLDEIWLVDRKEDGCSYIHNAADSMKVPYHKRLDKIYLIDQQMGGVPHLK